MKKSRFLKNFVIAFFSFSLFFSSCHRAEISAKNTSENVEIKKGDKIGGFSVKGTYDYIGETKVVMFEHEKTGAIVLHIANNDVQRGFAIGYRTFAKDNKGIPHVFEHATLAGSEKYPSSNLFFQMMEQTYSTYVNAATAQFLTYYPSASLSEDQLMANFDMYLNGLKTPAVMKDERAMSREAYRYVLENEADELTATGAVYSEMKGRETITELGSFYTKQFMYPNSASSFRTGGNPEDVLKITWQELKDFHDTYYHPSNMLCTFYGKLDISRFLQVLETEYLSGFDKKEIKLTDDLYEPWTGFREKTFDFPATEDSETNNKSIVNYSLRIDGVSDHDSEIIGALLGMTFSKDSSWIRTELRKKLPGAHLGFYYNNLDLYPYMNFSFSNVNESDKDFLMALCDQALERVSQEGISKTIFEECELQQKFELIFENEDSEPITKMANFLYTWSVSGDPLKMLEYIQAIFEIRKYEGTTLVQDFLKTKAISSPQKSLVVIRPVKGLAEKKSLEEKKFFAEKKNSMSKDEISALVAYTKDFQTWSEENEKINLIDKVKAVSVQDLPEEADEVVPTDKTDDGIRIITADIGETDYFNATVYLDASTVPQDAIHDFILYAKLLESLPTESYTLEELENKLYTTVYSSFEGATSITYKEGGYNPYFLLSFTTLNEKAAEAWKLLEEIIFNTDFSDYNLIRSVAGRLANSRKQSLLSNPSGLGYTLAAIASENNDTLYNYYGLNFGLLSYYEKVAALDDSEMPKLVERLKSAKKIILNKNGMVFTCASSKSGIEKNISLMKDFASRLSAEKQEKQHYVFEPLPKNIAAAVTVNAAFNYSMISRKTAGNYDVKGDMYPLTSLIGDKFMIPTLRFKLGSYGAYTGINMDGIYEATYRDPNVKSSFDFFRTIPELLRSVELSQDDFDGYIMSVYSSLASPVPKRDLASSAFTSVLAHTYERGKKVRLMKETKQFNASSLEKYAQLYKTLNENAVNVTVANMQTINENRELYDMVITDLLK